MKWLDYGLYFCIVRMGALHLGCNREVAALRFHYSCLPITKYINPCMVVWCRAGLYSRHSIILATNKDKNC